MTPRTAPAARRPAGRRAAPRPDGFAPTPAFLARLRREARGYFRHARGSHDWDHTERVLELCLRIGRTEGADPVVLTLAALLHDIGRETQDRSGGRLSHAETGAAMAGKVLRKHRVPEATVERVLHCIRAHRFRRGASPRSPEARVLFDADKLDSIGAVGIGRAFLFAGEIGARLHDPGVDVRRSRPYTAEDTAYREFLVKLRKVRERIFTREGRRIARERHRFMVEFFARLNREVVGKL